jgi:hypothetical protein
MKKLPKKYWGCPHTTLQFSRVIMKSLNHKSAIALALTSAFLVACGSGGDSAPAPAAPTAAATANTTAPVTAASVAAVSGKAFAFPSGVAELGTTGPTSLTITDAAVDTFAVTSAAGNYSGTLSYGSCIFTVVTSAFAAPSPYAVGQTFTVANCGLAAPTAGAAANGVAKDTPVTFNLGTSSSSPVTIPVAIAANGAVTIGGAPVGSVPVAVPTGG